MRIVFMGTPDFAIPSLRVLADAGHAIVAVVTAPDKPAGRGKKLQASPVKQFAESRGLPVIQPTNLKDPAFVAELEALQPDLMVVVAFRMLPEAVWRIPRIGTFNLHASLLPQYRGAAPINWAIINGETKTGATTFFIDKQIDTGNILMQKEIDIPASWNAGDLHDALMEMGADLVLETVRSLEQNSITPKPQEFSGELKEAPKIFREDCRIDWNKSAADLNNFIRGLSPYPGAWTTLEGNTFKIYKAKPSERKLEPGKILIDKKDMVIGCGRGSLELEVIQPAGKGRMEAAAWIRGLQIMPEHVE